MHENHACHYVTKSKCHKMHTWVFLLSNSSCWTVAGFILKVQIAGLNSIYLIIIIIICISFSEFLTSSSKHIIVTLINSVGVSHFRRFVQMIKELQVQSFSLGDDKSPAVQQVLLLSIIIFPNKDAPITVPGCLCTHGCLGRRWGHRAFPHPTGAGAAPAW